MAAVPLHPAIRSGHCSSLIDLIDAPKLRLVAAECQAFHHNLNQKVCPPSSPSLCSLCWTCAFDQTSGLLILRR